MATPTLANSPALLSTLKPDTTMWWMFRLELNHLALRFLQSPRRRGETGRTLSVGAGRAASEVI
jgi:hypothetical protein